MSPSDEPARSVDSARLLAPAVASAVTGDTDGLGASLRAALAAGLPPAEGREGLLMVSLFAGFPRTLDTLMEWRDACAASGVELPAQPEAGLPDGEAERRALFRARGRALFDQVYGANSERVFAALETLDPELPHWVLADAYGRVLARPALSAADRERLAVVMLTAQRLQNQLRGHVRGALRCGATADDVRGDLAAAADWLPDDMVDAALASL